MEKSVYDSMKDLDWEDIPSDVREQILDKEGIPSDGNGNIDPNASDEVKKLFEKLKEDLLWVVWGEAKDGTGNALLAYQRDSTRPRFFLPSGEEFIIDRNSHFGFDYVDKWKDSYDLKSINFTGHNIVVIACGRRYGTAENGTLHTMKLYIPAVEGTLFKYPTLEHHDFESDDTRGGPSPRDGDIMSPGNIIVAMDYVGITYGGYYEVWGSNGNKITSGHLYASNGTNGIGREAWFKFFFKVDWYWDKYSDSYIPNTTPGHWEDTDGDGIPEWHPH